MISCRILRGYPKTSVVKNGGAISDAITPEAAYRLQRSLSQQSDLLLAQIVKTLPNAEEADGRIKLVRTFYEGSEYGDLNFKLDRLAENRVSLSEFTMYLFRFMLIRLMRQAILISRITPEGTSVWRGLSNGRYDVDIALDTAAQKLKRQAEEKAIRDRFVKWIRDPRNVQESAGILDTYQAPYAATRMGPSRRETDPVKIAKLRKEWIPDAIAVLNDSKTLDEAAEFAHKHIEILTRAPARSTLSPLQLQTLQLGGTITFASFLSTSLNQKVAKGFILHPRNHHESKTGEVVGFLLEFILPGGFPALPLHYGAEVELLLPPCLTFVAMVTLFNLAPNATYAPKIIKYIRLRPTHIPPAPTAEMMAKTVDLVVRAEELERGSELDEKEKKQVNDMFADELKQRCLIRVSEVDISQRAVTQMKLASPNITWDAAILNRYTKLRTPVPRPYLMSAYEEVLSDVSPNVVLPPSMTTTDSKARTLRLVSWNIYNGFEPLENSKEKSIDVHRRFLQTIQRMSPTILGLQEVAYRAVSKPVLLQSLRDLRLADVAECQASSLYNWYGNLVFQASPLPFGLKLAATSAHSLHTDGVSQEGRCVVRCSYEIPDQKRMLHVMNLQLDVHDSSNQVRLHEAKDLVSIVESILRSPQDMVVIMGDFNCISKLDYSPEHWAWLERNAMARKVPEDLQTLELLRTAGFVDAAHLKKLAIPQSVWSGKRVDFILCRNIAPSQIIRIMAIPALVTDHLPIVMDLDVS